MIVAKRTSRDSATVILPALTIFAALMTYVSLGSFGLVSVVGSISPSASWIAPPIAILLWLGMLKYVIGLIYPVIYMTEVFADRVIFSDTSNPTGPLVIQREDVIKFYVEPRLWWHDSYSGGLYPVLCETRAGATIKINWNFVRDANAQEFFDAIREQWGDEYAPASLATVGCDEK